MTQTQKSADAPKTSIELAREIHARFSRGALESCLELVTDDVEVVLVPTGRTFRGREELMEFMQFFHTAFPDIVLTHTNHVLDGDQLVVEASWRGTHRGVLGLPTGPVAPTGRKVEGGRIIEVMRMRGGKICRIVNYQDLGSWMRQLGLA